MPPNAAGTAEFCQVTTTVDSRAAAQALARSAVEARLAACGQVLGPVSSVYWWDGKLESTEEWMVLFKATVDGYPALEAHVRANHSYAVPEIICIPVIAGNPAYLAWMRTETAR